MDAVTSWEANSRSLSQELSHLPLNSEVHKIPPPAPVLSHMNPVHTLSPCFRNIHLNLILSSGPTSSKWYFISLGFPTKNVHAFLISVVPAACHAHLSSLTSSSW
jgi:hypothetical protein